MIVATVSIVMSVSAGMKSDNNNNNNNNNNEDNINIAMSGAANMGRSIELAYSDIEFDNSDSDITIEKLRQDLMEHVIKPVVPAKFLDENTIYHLNPSGLFVIGGPQGDAGLTGRKIIVDTYGGWGAPGGGAFSGKDYTKVDRSAAYAARWVAKSLVKAGLCKRVLVQISYAIGIAEPLSITIFSYGSSTKSEQELLDIVKNNFDLRPGKIVKDLDLKKPIYKETSCYGHFGREQFAWEKPKVLDF